MTTNTTPTDLKTSTEQTHRPAPEVRHDLPEGPRKKRHPLRWLITLLVIGGIAAFAVFQASRPAATPKKGAGGRGRGALGGPIAVAVAPASRQNVPVFLNGLGNVQAFYTVTVRSRVDGQLMSVMFKEGDFVKEGQLLAQIDPRPFEVQLEQAEGMLARDQAMLANAKLDLERYRGLITSDAIPKQQLDTQIATVGQTEGSIKQDQANIDNARLQLTYAKITAPINGRIGLRLVDPGNIVHAADTNGMLVITQLQPISVLFTIPEDSLPEVLRKLRAGARLPVEAWNRDNSKKLSSGYLLTVDNQIDATTGTSKLKAVFENRDFQLFPNQFVNIRLLVDTERSQIVVPTGAIQRGQQGAFVYVVTPDGTGSRTAAGVEAGTAHLRLVQPGVTEGDSTSVQGGVRVGEQVVTDGFDRLSDGAKVQIRPATGSVTLTPTGVNPQAVTGAGTKSGQPRGQRKGGKAGGPPPGVGTQGARQALEKGQPQ